MALVLATRQLVNVNKTMLLSQDKPWLYFYPVKKDYQFSEKSPLPTHYLYKNTGKGVALDINFQVYLDNQPSPKEYSLGSLSPKEEIKIIGLPNSHGEVQIENIHYWDINKEERVQDDVPITYE